MTLKTSAVALVVVVPLLLAGCQQAEQPGLEPLTPDETAAAPTAMETPQERWVSGNIEQVDLDAGTFTVAAGGFNYDFQFSDATEVTGAAGTQGLANSEGGWVTVYYTEENDIRRATRVEIQP